MVFREREVNSAIKKRTFAATGMDLEARKLSEQSEKNTYCPIPFPCEIKKPERTGTESRVVFTGEATGEILIKAHKRPVLT